MRPDEDHPEPAEAPGTRNDVRAQAIDGPVVQAGLVHGGVNIHLPRQRPVVDENQRRKRRKDAVESCAALLVLAAIFTSPITVPLVKEVLATTGAADAPNVSTSHVGDCAAWNSHFEDVPDPSRAVTISGVAVLVRVPCWYRSAIFRVTAIMPKTQVDEHRRDHRTSTFEASVKALCRAQPGWDEGTYVRSLDTVFCLAHN